MRRIITAIVIVLSAVEVYAAYPDTIKKIKSPKGTTLQGVVYCGDTPLVGVPVTDGKEITYTNERGEYSLASDKRMGLVYISSPSGYRPLKKGVKPLFWASTTLSAKKIERHDFELEKIDDSVFSVIVCSDSHLINDSKRNDIKYFKELFVPSVKSTCQSYGNVPMFTICLGDITWDRFWYQNNFDLNNVHPLLEGEKYPTAFYGVIGNHDHDAATPCGPDTDFLSSAPYRKVFGPTYYSMDCGGVHFLVLDDIIYKNEPKKGLPAYKNVVGSRNYDTCVTDEQVEWVRKDLAKVDVSTPVVVCLHAPMMKYGYDGELIEAQTKGHFDSLFSILSKYNDVTVWSGHQHKNNVSYVRGAENMKEFNVAAVGGELWKTPTLTSYDFCDDGTDAGYYVFDFTNGKSKNTYYSVHSGKCPVRMYDMNAVGKFYAEWEKRSQLEHAFEILPAQKDYSKAEYANYVYINCYLPEPGTEITATENGESLEVEKVTDSDPMAAVVIISNSVKKKKSDRNANGLSQVQHMYRVKTRSSDTPVTVTVKATNGETYTSTLSRPSSFKPFK